MTPSRGPVNRPSDQDPETLANRLLVARVWEFRHHRPAVRDAYEGAVDGSPFLAFTLVQRPGDDTEPSAAFRPTYHVVRWADWDEELPRFMSLNTSGRIRRLFDSRRRWARGQRLVPVEFGEPSVFDEATEIWGQDPDRLRRLLPPSDRDEIAKLIAARHWRLAADGPWFFTLIEASAGLTQDQLITTSARLNRILRDRTREAPPTS